MTTEIIRRPASNAHSPHRKPRYRGAIRAAMFDTRRDIYLWRLSMGDTKAQAAKVAGYKPDSMEQLAEGNPDFKQKVEDAIAKGTECREIAAGILDSELPKTAQEYLDIGQNAEDVRVRADVKYKILKGRRVLEGEAVNVAVGVQVNEPPKYVEVHEIGD